MEEDKINKKLNNSSEYSTNSTNVIKPNYIICPKCKEICKYDIKNYRIKLYDCKNKRKI